MDKVSKLGYKDNSPYKNKDNLTIESNSITMKGVSIPLLLEPDNDPPMLGIPGKDYVFPNSTKVVERKFKEGGQVSELLANHISKLSDKDKAIFLERYREMGDSQKQMFLHSLRVIDGETRSKYEKEDIAMMNEEDFKQYQLGGQFQGDALYAPWGVDPSMVAVDQQIDVVRTDDQVDRKSTPTVAVRQAKPTGGQVASAPIDKNIPVSAITNPTTPTPVRAYLSEATLKGTSMERDDFNLNIPRQIRPTLVSPRTSTQMSTEPVTRSSTSVNLKMPSFSSEASAIYEKDGFWSTADRGSSLRNIPPNSALPTKVTDGFIKLGNTVDAKFERVKDSQTGVILFRNKRTGKYTVEQ